MIFGVGFERGIAARKAVELYIVVQKIARARGQSIEQSALARQTDATSCNFAKIYSHA